MKFLFDFLPLLFFFGTYKLAKAKEQMAAAFATEHLGMLVSGGVVGVKEAPMVLATVAIIIVTVLQVSYLLARRKKVEPMLWVGVVLAVVFGGATIWFHDPTFIKWKFSVLNWAMGLGFLVSQSVFGVNLVQKMMGEHVQLPPSIWNRLNLAWVAFFGILGLLNLYFAYNLEENLWLNVKIYGGTLVTFLFIFAQAFYINKYLPPDTDAPAENQPPA